jgi:RPA family protein
MEKQQKRQVAYKVRVKEILDGEYVKEEGWMPNYIRLIDGAKVSRVNLVGVVVLKTEEQNYAGIIIDDGSGKIPVRNFENSNLFDATNIGDIVLIIGRPREFGEKYVVPEIIKKVQDPLWIEVRKLELKKPELKVNDENAVKKDESNPSEVIFSLIKGEDKGDGVDVEDIIKKSNVSEADLIIRNLLEEGEIFELKPGRVKILE